MHGLVSVSSFRVAACILRRKQLGRHGFVGQFSSCEMSLRAIRLVTGDRSSARTFSSPPNPVILMDYVGLLNGETSSAFLAKHLVSTR